MSFFSEKLSVLGYPVQKEGSPGLRRSQIAAIHAISAHFFDHQCPAIVVMPTGSGKTAIITACPLVLEATRVLVLTPSRLVREQIVKEFRSLNILKKVGAFPSDCDNPKVYSASSIIDTEDGWRNLLNYDVVVATVASIHSSIDKFKELTSVLFDLVIVDEAHHSPARTWNKVLDVCLGARQILFTATPYRRDDKEVAGKIVFNYDIRKAHADGIFGDLEYVAAEGDGDEDVAIAKKTEEIFLRDKVSRLNHYVMVRVDSLSRAKYLLGLYNDITELRLVFVCGKHSLAHVERVLNKLTLGQIDGIVCVDMFGEGVDIPNFKIASIHSPHKSLAVTLQFIGRFARTSGISIGKASFIASPNTSAGELSSLYESKADWKELIHNLSYTRVQEEVEKRHFISSFREPIVNNASDVSLYDISPYAHAMVYEVRNAADINIKPTAPFRYKEVFFSVSEEHRTSILISEKRYSPDWIRSGLIENVEYAIILCYLSSNSKLLFICSSLRSFGVYKSIAKQIARGGCRPVYHSQLSKALNGIESPEFFSIGMKNRHFSGGSESYRTITGPAADKAIQQSDARIYDRGHCFGRGIIDGRLTTLGVSSSSKIWSNSHYNIPELATWLESVAAKICSNVACSTRCNLDVLSTGEVLKKIDRPPFSAIWPSDVYEKSVSFMFIPKDKETVHGKLVDLDIEIIGFSETSIDFRVYGGGVDCVFTFLVDSPDNFKSNESNDGELRIFIDDDAVSAAEYFDYNPISFFTEDLSRIQGNCIYKNSKDFVPIDDNSINAIEWSLHGVDIQREKPAPKSGLSLFEWTERFLKENDYICIFNDDGAGEIADFIAVKSDQTKLYVDLFHCKASSEAKPGARIDELYEVCGQAIKSSYWAKPKQITDQIRRRQTLKGPYFVKGSFDEFDSIVNKHRPAPPDFRVYIIQPGCSKVKRSHQMNDLLAATNAYLRSGGITDFGVYASE